MRPLLLLLVAGAALAAAPSTAVAKGVVGAEVCGATGCRPVGPEHVYAALPAGEEIRAPVGAAFVTVRVAFGDPSGEPDRDRFTYLPSRGVARWDSATRWIKLTPRSRSALDRIVARATPRPAAQLTGVVAPAAAAPDDAGTWWPIAAGTVAALVLLALLARYATSALKARPRASKSAN